MHDLLLRLLEAMSTSAAAFSLAGLGLSVANFLYVLWKTRKAQIQEFDQIMESSDIGKLGDYLTKTVGKFRLQDYSSRRDVREKIDHYLDHLIEFVGPTSEFREPIPPTEPERSPASPPPLSEIVRMQEELDKGEIWNALSRYRRFVEIILRRVGENHGITDLQNYSASRLVQRLQAAELISEQLASRLKYSISVANRGVHGLDVPLSIAKEAILGGLSVLSNAGFISGLPGPRVGDSDTTRDSMTGRDD